MGTSSPAMDNWAAALLTGERPAARVAPDTEEMLTSNGCSSAPIVEYAPDFVKSY